MLKWQEKVRLAMEIAVKKPPRSVGHHLTGLSGRSKSPPRPPRVPLYTMMPDRKDTHMTLQRKKINCFLKKNQDLILESAGRNAHHNWIVFISECVCVWERQRDRERDRGERDWGEREKRDLGTDTNREGERERDTHTHTHTHQRNVWLPESWSKLQSPHTLEKCNRKDD